MAKIYGTPLMMGGGGGVSDTLPPMVTNLAAVAGNQKITVSYTNPESDALAGVLVVYKTGSYPTKPTDGVKVDAGLAESVKLEGLENGTDYYIRVFPYNAKKQYQTLIDGATTTARPSEGPKQVTDLKVTGSGSSPVLSWKNPTDDPTYHETVVIQKVDSAPTSLTDGTEIYRGTGETVSANGLEQFVNYYFGVFTINAEGGTRGPVVSDVYRYEFPAEPTEYLDCAEISETTEYEFPESGWFRIDAIAKSGDGGSTVQISGGLVSTPGGGGTGGYSRSEIAANKGDIISIKIQNGDITISSETIENLNMSSSHGADGIVAATASDDSRGGSGGTANGGNKINETGLTGSAGRKGRMQPGETYFGGSGAAKSIEINSSKTYRTAGGMGRGVRRLDHGYTYINGTFGTAAKVFISRGNTNISSPSAASTLSLTPRNASIEASWTNSEDPESVGTILVSNSDHIPTNPTDGTSVDVAEATTYTISDLPNDTPTYVSLFAYNADKTKYSAAKSDVEIPREVTWYDVQEDVKEDIADAQEDAEQAQEVVLLTRDFLPDTLALTLPEIYDEWNPDSVSYIGKDTATEDKPASIVRYNNALYRCLQSHTSQASWTPEASPSLWVLIDDPAIEWPEWKQPTGAHDAYSLGAKVSHNGKKWISQIAANTVEPGTDERYWKEYTE